MKMKHFLIAVCTLFTGACIISCGSKGSSENPSAEAATEEVADEGTPNAKAAIAELEDMYKWMVESEKKAESGEMSKNEAMGFLAELLVKGSAWEEKYNGLTEDDYTPKQWARLQEVKQKIQEMMEK